MNLATVRKIYQEPKLNEPVKVTHTRLRNNHKVTGKERKAIYQWWLENKATRTQTALKFNRSKATIDRIITSYNTGSKVI